MQTLDRNAARVSLLFATAFALLFPGESAAQNLRIIATAQDSTKRIVMVAKPTTGPASPRQLAIGRLLPDGNTDTSWGTDGWVYVDAPPNSVGTITPTAMTVTVEGKVLIASEVDGKIALTRVMADGSPDWWYGTYGGSIMDNNSDGYRINAILETPDGGVLAAGSYRVTPSDEKDVALLRYEAYGGRNLSWGTMGASVIPMSTGENEARAMVAVDYGKVVIVGSARALGGHSDFLAARIDAYGMLDPMFGTAGKVIASLFSDFDDEANAIIRLANGKLFVGGRSGHMMYPNSQDGFGFMRLLADGQLDSTYGYMGTNTQHIMVDGYLHDADSAVTALSLLGTPDGTQVLAGGVAVKLTDGQTYFVLTDVIDRSNYQIPTPYDWTTIGPRTDGNDEIVGLHINDEYRAIAVGNRTTAAGVNPYRVRYVSTTGLIETDFDAVNNAVDTMPDYMEYSTYPRYDVEPSTEMMWSIPPFGFTAPLRIVVQNGEWSYNCDRSTWTTAPGWFFREGDRFCVRHFSSATPGGSTATTIDVGSYHGTLTSVTAGGMPVQTFISGPPTNVANTPSSAFTLSSSATNPYYECMVDGGPFAECGASLVVGPLPDGVHRFTARSREGQYGQPGDPATIAWYIDSIPPETTITSGPSGTSTANSATFEFGASESAHFECRLDGGAWAQCYSPATYPALADGNHVFEVRAIDEVGTPDATPATRAWTVSVAPPDTAIDGGPSPYFPKEASFTFTASPPDAATFECRLDGAAFAPCTSPRSFTNLSEGGHSFQARAVNAAGADPTPATFNWTIDTIAPIVTIDSGPTGVTANPVTFVFSSPEPGVTITCRLSNSSTFYSCESPWTYFNLSSGSYTFEVKATDASGNSTNPPASRSFVVDATIPQTTIVSGPPALTGSQTAAFTFTTNESPATFECRVDGAAFAACTSPATFTGLADGAHTFAVRAVDAAGNRDDTPASHAWTIDADFPETLITSNPPASTPSTSAAFTFGSDEGGSTFECQLDNAASYTPCTSPAAYSGLAQGSHRFRVRAIDAVGNVDATPSEYNWTVTDTTLPDTTITGGPSGPVNTTSASFTFTASEAATFECRRDGQAYAACTSPKSYTGLGTGAHTFDVRARDAAGNLDASPATRSWTVDTTAPSTTITSSPTNNTTNTTGTFSFTSSESGSTFECKMDSAAFAACTSAKTYTGLSRTTHTFQVRARDPAGNQDASPATYTWRIR